MFKGLRDEIVSLNSDVKNITNCEKAKKLRKKLLAIGLPLAIIGYLGVFVCFVLFATAGADGFSENGFSARLIVPFVLIIPMAVIACIGTMLASLAFKIIITGYTTDLADSVVGNNCPSCGDKITEEELFCNKCGKPLRRQCPKCNHVNSIKNDYCEKCGEKLN